MNINGKPQKHFIFILIAIAILLLSACQPGAVTSTSQPAQPSATVPPVAPATATQPAAQPSTPGVVNLPAVTLDTSDGLAQNVANETLEAVPAGADIAWTEAAPRSLRLTLQGYPVTIQQIKPQIFVYPAGELASANEQAGKVAASLQALLQTRQAGDQMPYLPLVFSAKQVLDAQVHYLDFKSGKGVRFLTQFGNGLGTINNYDLLYTFQGLTSDGKYYISAVLPITNPELPATDEVSSEKLQELYDFPYSTYLAKTAEMLNQQPAASFTPDLAKLDAMIQSIEVK